MGLNLDFQQWFVLVLFSILVFVISNILTLHTIIFNSEAYQRGMNSLVLRLIFEVHILAGIIFSPMYAIHLPKMGLKRVLCVLIILEAIAVGLFGLLDVVSTYWVFLVGALLFRFLEGVGNVGIVIAIYTVIPLEFPNVAPLIYGILGVWFACGFLGGPILGQFLFDIGGFTCPFLTMAAILVTLSIFIPLLFWRTQQIIDVVEGNGGKKALTMPQLLKKPLIFVVMVILGLCQIFMASLMSNLPKFFRTVFGLDQASIGWILGLLIICIALSSVVWGILLTRIIAPSTVGMIGTILYIVSSFLIGPFPLLSREPNLLLTCLGLGILGLGYSGFMNSTAVGLIRESLNAGCAKRIPTFSLVSGMYVMTLCIGTTVGLLLGVIYDSVGPKAIPYTNMILSVILVVMSSFYLGWNSLRRIFCQKLFTEKMEKHEEDPLLSEA